jgi:lysozyme
MTGDGDSRSRRWIVISATGLALCGLVAGWWFVWVPNWRPSLKTGESFGIDVSSHQGDIDWERVARDEIDFAYVKATEGADFVDERFADNWDAVARSGLRRGAYHFFTLCTAGAEQAENFLRVAPPVTGALPPAVDLELAGNCSARPPAQQVNEQLDAFLRRVEEAWNEEIVIYAGDDFEERYPVRGRLGRPLWIRRFLVRPDDDEWVIWQLHGYARVEGVEGAVDLDVMRTR